MKTRKHKTAFWAGNVIGTFEKRTPNRIQVVHSQTIFVELSPLRAHYIFIVGGVPSIVILKKA